MKLTFKEIVFLLMVYANRELFAQIEINSF